MRENCIICGAELVYFGEQKEMKCEICGKSVLSNASCKNGHFVCDECHKKDAKDVIKDICLASDSENPIEIAVKIMENPLIHMHGPEHHMTVGASLLTAYSNCVAKEFENDLDEVLRRTGQVPGGMCGFWGICGAAASTGVFYSVITKATPLTGEHWTYNQEGVMAASAAITKYPGPRCCKRTTLLSITAAVEYVFKRFGIKMKGCDDKIICSHSDRNNECIGQNCPFFNGK